VRSDLHLGELLHVVSGRQLLGVVREAPATLLQPPAAPEPATPAAAAVAVEAAAGAVEAEAEAAAAAAAATEGAAAAAAARPRLSSARNYQVRGNYHCSTH
jgi:hypothetical protein